MSAVAVTAAACSGQSSSPSSGLTAPALSSPADDSIVQARPVLSVHNATSTSTGARTYDFQVTENQAAFTNTATALFASASGVAEGVANTTFTLERDLRPSTRYYWRARAVQGGAAGPWSASFRFRTDVLTNLAPVIVSLTASSTRVEGGAEIDLTAVVQDQETTPAALTYEWTAPGGTFTANGASARWRAPAGTPPGTFALTLTVIERYTAVDVDGRQESRENRTSASTTVVVNNSEKEITDLVLTFLDDFVHSDRTPEFCVRNFSDNCAGKAWELDDIRNNRANFTIDPARSTFSVSSISFDARTAPTKATVLAPCFFASTVKTTGRYEPARGTCRLITVYEASRWRLCESWFDPPAGSITTFIF